MQLVRSPNRWSCLAASFAMVLGVPLKRILEFVGHDGSEIWFPDLPEPSCYRGFHIQEMIRYAYQQDATVVPFEPIPIAQSGNTWKQLPEYDIRHVMDRNLGVFTGETSLGQRHAVAWDGFRPYDPGNIIRHIEDFTVECFWLVTPRS